ncbi:uncharacterized protein LOC110870429 [Helianthus annuus]|uniref:uncharacterized protein LOC110870429 n=1 Tax=Helianthus annuus TaxID=4232 RepID=UPI000B9028DA|nr:uncharacterized protein LOC110870429 [Helianthus annuus]
MEHHSKVRKFSHSVEHNIGSLLQGDVSMGDMIRIWLDPWLSDVPLRVLFLNLILLENHKGCLTSEMFEVSDIGVVWKWEWKHSAWSGTEEADLLNLYQMLDTFQPSEWNKRILKKVNIFAWQASLNRLPTLSDLTRRNVPVDSTLSKFCSEDEETGAHLLISCRSAGQIWQNISSWCMIAQIYAFTVTDLLSAHDYYRLGRRKKEILYGIILTACWCI